MEIAASKTSYFAKWPVFKSKCKLFSAKNLDLSDFYAQKREVLPLFYLFTFVRKESSVSFLHILFFCNNFALGNST